jgi:hypothetical protein
MGQTHPGDDANARRRPSVTGGILLLALTLLLAGCLGGAGGGAGDPSPNENTPTTVGVDSTVQAPDTAFDVAQETRFYQGGDVANLTTVDLTHAGGSSLDVERVRVTVAGNASVWGLEKARTADKPSQWDYARPVPDFRPTLEGDDTVEFASGDTWSAFGTDGPNLEYVGTGDQYVAYWTQPKAQFPELKEFPFPGGEGKHRLTPLDTGDEVRVEWTAASGDETQTLTTYSVQ